MRQSFSSAMPETGDTGVLTPVPQTPAALHAVERVYRSKAGPVTALAGVTASFAAGTFTAVMGPSGSGKSTLLHCAAGLDRPTSGSVTLEGADLAGMSERALARLLSGERPRRAAVMQALERVGLAGTGRARPGQLSGGQQQRVAIARALIGAPGIVFADEPTGALDSATAAGVLGLLGTVVRGAGRTVVMVTHDPLAAAHADRVVFLADGRIAGELRQPSAAAVAERMTRLTGRGRAATSPTAAQAGPSW